MTLKDKFKPFVFYVSDSFNVSREKDKEKNANECEKIADEFAIGFAEWLSKKERTNFQVLSYCKKTIMWFTSKNGTGVTTNELLEIYKKEKGL